MFMLLCAMSAARAAAPFADHGETLLDFPDKQAWCVCQDAADDYESITKDAVFYEQVYRILGAGDSKIPLLNRWVAASLFKKGTELIRQGQYAKAIARFDELDRRFAGNDGAARGGNEILLPDEWAFAGLNNKGVALSRQGRFAEALAVYDELIERGSKPPYSAEMMELREALHKSLGDQFDQRYIDEEMLGLNSNNAWRQGVVAAAAFNKALIFQQQGKQAEALAIYDAIDQRVRRKNEEAEGGEAANEDSSAYDLKQYAEENNPLIWLQLIKAQLSKAEILEQQGKTEEVDDVYAKTISLMGRQYHWIDGFYEALAANPAPFQELLVKAILKWGEALGKQGRFALEAVAYESFGEALRWDDNLATRQTVFAALLKWAETARQREDEKRELRAHELLYQFFYRDEDPAIREQLVRVIIRMGDDFVRAKESPLTLDFKGFARDKNPANRELIASAFLKWAQAIRQQNGDAEDEIGLYQELYYYFSDDREPAIRAHVEQALRHLLENANQPDEDGNIDEDVVASILNALRELSQAPVEEPEKVVADDDADAGSRCCWDEARKTESLSLLSPEAASQKLKPILISLFITDMDNSVATYDEIVQRFSEDKDPAVQKQVGRALLHKAMALNHMEDKEKIAEAIDVYDEVVQRFGNEIDVTAALGNAAEAALIIGRTEEAIARAKTLQAHPDADKKDNAIMAFIIWLADPKTPLQNVQKAIHAADNEEFHWSFKEVTPFINNLPKTRRKQAECFTGYFMQYLDEKGLRACLKK
ncbi:MAG: hypothetical protein LBQ81_03880 [Zoogloeaceae bacterium]|nr:hypothetical protein [Zoogloeaceae bacterium]